MSTLNVLFLIDKLQPAGTQKHLIDLVSNINLEKFNLTVVCIENKGEWFNKLDNLQISSQCFFLKKMVSFRLFSVLIKLVKLIWMKNIHIIHCYLPMANLLGGILKLINPTVKLITTRRDMGISRTKKLFLIDQWILNRIANLVIVNSNSIKLNLIKTENIDQNKIKMIYNGIDDKDEQFDKNKVRLEIRNQYKVHRNECLIALIGDMNSSVKGHRILFEALQNINRPIKTLIVGDGILKDSHIKEISKRRLNDKVIFVGPLEDTKPILRALDFIVVPSLSEGMANIILEAMMAECPIIATNVGGNPELIEDGITGLLVPVNDPISLKNKMIYLMESDRIQNELKLRAKEFVMTHMRLDKMVNSIQNEYWSLLPKIKKELDFATH